jgi:hypothetical protein
MDSKQVPGVLHVPAGTRGIQLHSKLRARRSHLHDDVVVGIRDSHSGSAPTAGINMVKLQLSQSPGQPFSLTASRMGCSGGCFAVAAMRTRRVKAFLSWEPKFGYRQSSY